MKNLALRFFVLILFIGCYIAVNGQTAEVKFNPAIDLNINPPPSPCVIQFDGIDAFSKKRRKETAPEILFTFTDEKLLPYFKEDDYMVCEGYISDLYNSGKYLILNIVVKSNNARQTYGHLKTDAMVVVKTVKGANITLFNINYDTGRFNDKTGKTTYTGHFRISSEDEKELVRCEIDKIRIIWSTGFEDYNVYNVNFFTNQLNCINQK